MITGGQHSASRYLQSFRDSLDVVFVEKQACDVCHFFTKVWFHCTKIVYPLATVHRRKIQLKYRRFTLLLLLGALNNYAILIQPRLCVYMVTCFVVNTHM